MTFLDNIPWMFIFVSFIFLTILWVKTSLLSPHFTNPLSYRVGKKCQDINFRNKGWVWSRNYLFLALPLTPCFPSSKFLRAICNMVSKRLEKCLKHTAWWVKRGLSSLCSAHSCPERASRRWYGRDVNFLAIRCLIQSCREVTLFPLNLAFVCP